LLREVIPLQKTTFMAKTDLEIGDRVRLNSQNPIDSSLVWKINEIRTIHYLRGMNIEFEFMIVRNDNMPRWVKRKDIIYPIGGDIYAT